MYVWFQLPNGPERPVPGEQNLRKIEEEAKSPQKTSWKRSKWKAMEVSRTFCACGSALQHKSPL
jgi:hypothetical protein